MKTSIVELEADHPGFNDPEYRKRRDEIALLAMNHVVTSPPARITYTKTETATWRTVFEELTALYKNCACSEFNESFGALAYRADEIPQLADVSAFLEKRTGFRLRPVAGLVSPRDFLHALSQGIFCSTQYIRHGSRPHYTPEPDLVHELMGHAPMLAIQDFADLSRRIGDGIEGATDKQVEQLATLYWYTVEYGVVRQGGRLRAYGAGLLSSYGELSRALSGEVEILRFDPERAKDVPYPITSYQPMLWEVSSIQEGYRLMDEYVRSMQSV